MTTSNTRYHVFETVAGFVAIAWNERGVASLRLPEQTTALAERAVLRARPDALRGQPGGDVIDIVTAVTRYFAGDHVEFHNTPVDLGAQEPFFAQVYDAIRKLGWGETTTYGGVATSLGAGPGAAQAVGQAMARNPVPLIVPCHRVLAAGGKIGGFSAPGGSSSKLRMLALEGVVVQSAAKTAQATFAF